MEEIQILRHNKYTTMGESHQEKESYRNGCVLVEQEDVKLAVRDQGQLAAAEKGKIKLSSAISLATVAS